LATSYLSFITDLQSTTEVSTYIFERRMMDANPAAYRSFSCHGKCW